MMILLRIIVFPFALIYGFVVHMRNYFYDLGIFNSKEFETPTVCVGNLSLGGAGKTPMVEFLVFELQEAYKIAVLSRGYKRKTSGYVLADTESIVDQLGDEPYQVYRKFSNISLAVDADRGNGIANLESTIKPDLIILDDAFQHRKVRPSFSVLLTAYDKLYCDDYFVPAGTLRDGRNQAGRANVIVVTKCPPDLSENQRNRIVEKLKPKPHQKVLFSSLQYGATLKGGEGQITLEDLKQREITLVTGIANPDPLIHYLKEKCLDFEHLKFKDHHSFTKNEIEKLNSRNLILTTEKDFVRLQGKVKDLLYVEIKHKFLENGKMELINDVEALMKPSS